MNGDVNSFTFYGSSRHSRSNIQRIASVNVMDNIQLRILGYSTRGSINHLDVSYNSTTVTGLITLQGAFHALSKVHVTGWVVSGSFRVPGSLGLWIVVRQLVQPLKGCVLLSVDRIQSVCSPAFAHYYM